jgi:hypothetical protein
LRAAIAAGEPADAPVRPWYILGDHWLEVAFERICAGDNEDDVMDDYGWVRITDAERAAIAWCVGMAETTATECDEELTALRGLLERLK